MDQTQIVHTINSELAESIASELLHLGCVVLSPDDPFTYASGLKGPIYCDNRKLLTHPQVRDKVINGFEQVIAEYLGLSISEVKGGNLKGIDGYAGLATGGIPAAAILSDRHGVPMSYVRSKPKGHGKGRIVEGDLEKLKKVILIEDLINQGSSIASILEPLRATPIEVDCVFSVVSYEMQNSQNIATEQNLKMIALTGFNQLVKQAQNLGKIDENQVQMLHAWHKDPVAWSEARFKGS